MKQIATICFLSTISLVTFAQTNPQQAVPIDSLIGSFLTIPANAVGIKWSEVRTKFPGVQWNEQNPKEETELVYSMSADIPIAINGKIPVDGLKEVLYNFEDGFKKNENYGKIIKWGVVLFGTIDNVINLVILNNINTPDIVSPGEDLDQIFQKLGLSAEFVAGDEDNDWGGGAELYRLRGTNIKESAMVMDWSCGNAGCATTFHFSYNLEMEKKWLLSKLVNNGSKSGGLGVNIEMEDGLVKVVSVMENTPANRAGVKAGDLIVRIGDKPVKGMTLTDAILHMRGKPETQVKLSIMRKGKSQPIDMTVTREEL
jgi:hypothetical protein